MTQNTLTESFDFDTAVAEAYEAFPQMANSIFFVDANTRRPIHPDAETQAQLTAALDAPTAFGTALTQDCSQLRGLRQSSCKIFYNNGQPMFFVLLYLEKDMESALDGPQHLRAHQHLAFDHEFAHALIEKANGGSTVCESVADSYAALRHFQRYGTKTGMIETLMQRRAALSFANNDVDHFTSPALEEVLSVRKSFDFTQLNPMQVARMAEYIGSKSAPRGAEKRALTRSFKKLSAAFNEMADDTPLRKLANSALTARAAIVGKWGKVALKAFLDNKVALEIGGQNVTFKSAYWRGVRAALKARA